MHAFTTKCGLRHVDLVVLIVCGGLLWLLGPFCAVCAFHQEHQSCLKSVATCLGQAISSPCAV
jgi:hypothetical protein